MSELRFDWYEMPAATLGPENPLPALRWHCNESTSEAQARMAKTKLPADRAAWLASGGPLPHRLQDSFDRVRTPRKFRAAILENDRLRATFLTELGGRLWSLYHKPTKRELLFANPIWQPANIGIRHGWFAGGIEWNAAVMGHTCYGCSPLFVARLESPAGHPVLRMYEWDRTRGTPYQLDFFLPEGSEFLYVRGRLTNPHAFEVPMYWWSNVALSGDKDLRIIAPARRLFRHAYDTGKLLEIDVVDGDGNDRSYISRLENGSDGYFKIADNQRKFVAGIYGDGIGLVQASTPRLIGRKEFTWGNTPGGKTWLDWLSLPNHPYIEMQSGLALTQGQYLQMPAGADWSWLEAYGMCRIGPAAAHAPQYETAWRSVDAFLAQALPVAKLEEQFAASAVLADRKPDEMLQQGTPWGALERKRRELAGEKPFNSASLVFDDAALTEEASPWLTLLKTGQFPGRKPFEDPGCFMTQPEWCDLLEKAIASGKSSHWLSWLHVGVMKYRSQDIDGAKVAWETSLKLEPSGWAYRNLAVVAKDQDRLSDGADLYLKACRMLPGLWQLAVECCQTLFEAQRPQDVVKLLDELDASITQRSRLKLMRAKAAVEMGELETAENILRNLELTDVREGENSLTEVWFWLNVKKVGKAEGLQIDDALCDRVWREIPPLGKLDFVTTRGLPRMFRLPGSKKQTAKKV